MVVEIYRVVSNSGDSYYFINEFDAILKISSLSNGKSSKVLVNEGSKEHLNAIQNSKAYSSKKLKQSSSCGCD